MYTMDLLSEINNLILSYHYINFFLSNLHFVDPTSVDKRAKLGIIHGGLQRASQDIRVAVCFNFYAIKISLFRVSMLGD